MTCSSSSSPDTSASHVRVVARIRPLSQAEQEQGSKPVICSMEDDNNNPHNHNDLNNRSQSQLIQACCAAGNKRWFELDAVFGTSSTQRHVYEQSGARAAVCEDVFKGYNATILAYGQTGSGKTHTMGTAALSSMMSSDPDEDGLIPRACVDLFQNVQDKCDGNAAVELSYLEIYNEEIRDLLAPEQQNQKPLKIRETLQGEVYVSGLTAVPVLSPGDVGLLMEQASQKRVVASTKMNAVSSRSHAICTLTISGVVEQQQTSSSSNNNNEEENTASSGNNTSTQRFTSKLTLVDLAGSERIKKTGASGNRRQEGISINKGLFVLGQVVSALSEASSSSSNKTTATPRKPPYRDSILTRLLQNSLGGNSRTIMVACVSPADVNADESINTLRYATSARKIQSHATQNLVQQYVSPAEAAALRRENQLLQTQVTELQDTVRRLLLPSEQPLLPSRPVSPFSSSTDDSTSLSPSMSSSSCLLGRTVVPVLEADSTDSSSSSSSSSMDNNSHHGLALPNLIEDDTVQDTNNDDSNKDKQQQQRIASLEKQVETLKKQLQKQRSTANLVATASSSNAMANSAAMIEVPALKMQVELLKTKLQQQQQIQDENNELRLELAEVKADAESARTAASKLSDILTHLKELRRNAISKKKEELKLMIKDEAWVLFMGTLLEGRADQMSSLVMDFHMFKNAVAQGTDDSGKRKQWYGGDAEEWDPAVRERMIQDQVTYFLTGMVELQNSIKEECQSLREMRESIKRECAVLQDEIGKDEVHEDKLDRGGEDQMCMLEKLKEVWAASRHPVVVATANEPKQPVIKSV